MKDYALCKSCVPRFRTLPPSSIVVQSTQISSTLATARFKPHRAYPLHTLPMPDNCKNYLVIAGKLKTSTGYNPIRACLAHCSRVQ